MDLAEQTWVITGAAGTVGRTLRAGLAGTVGRLRVLDIAPQASAHDSEELLTADVTDLTAMTDAFAGAHGVVHLAAIPDEDDFHDLVRANVVGTYTVFEAARRAGVARVVYASSNRATGGYPTATTLDPSMPVRPDGYYGVTKVTGEALGRVFADKFGLAVACLRIGSFNDRPEDARQLSTWLSPADAVAAFWAAMTAPDLTFATFYAVSANGHRWWDLAAGERLGFTPRDNADDHADGLTPVVRDQRPQGGRFATARFTLDRQRH
ncbi:MAG TPA: NAD(P)-dependent oxidoreductase [Mycobacteriales bacterium]